MYEPSFALHHYLLGKLKFYDDRPVTELLVLFLDMVQYSVPSVPLRGHLNLA